MSQVLFREELIKKLYLYDLVKTNDNQDDDYLLEIINNLNLVDETISKSLYDYTIDRLSYLDRAILRLATYSLLKKDMNESHVFNEMLELTKKYTDLGDLKQKNFNHKVLSNIRSYINGNG